jgi:hypothetical protein
MNKLKPIQFSALVLLLCFISIEAYGQKQTKNFKETFTVSKDAVLNVNTSHADIEFETWSKDAIEIEATIELEGATDEEATQYFKQSGFEILGNSKKVSISTGSNNNLFRSYGISDLQNFHIEMPEFPEIHAFDFDFDFEELTDMPILPISPKTAFDHKAFKKDGEKYLKKWQKEFQESFDDEHVEKLEKWAEQMEEKQEKMAKKREQMMEKRADLLEKRNEKRHERLERMEEKREERMELLHERLTKNGSSRVIIVNGDSIQTSFNGGPNIFYSSSNGSHKNYKVKKTIKVKMPKGMKIKMDVRHGEVKLADNIWHMDANLSHASLWAASIDGDNTMIKASYSPVNIDKWYLGNLQANYSENINLKEVFEIKLNTTSSNVKIDKLIKKAFIKNDFGQLKIGAITKDFTDLDITLQNAELDFKGPDVAFDIYINSTSTLVKSPAKINLESTQNHNHIISKGYHINKNGERSIVINAKYSDVKIQ